MRETTGNDMCDEACAVDLAVIGAGAAGMMAAVTAAERGVSAVVIEKNKFAGKKLRITGKGRCNVTNNCTPTEFFEAVGRNTKFLYGAVNRFTPADTVRFFEDSGVPLKTERGRRVFPVSDKAADITDALLRRMKNAGVRVIYSAPVTAIEPIEAEQSESDGYAPRPRYRVKYRGGEILAEHVIVATGGVSYPATGSTGDGHRILGELGVGSTELRASLVPIETREDMSELMGLTLKNVRLTASHGSKTVYTEVGEMLFTHFGVSGPLVLSASANMQEHPTAEYSLSVNLKPALSEEELDRRLISDLTKYSARDFVNSLGDLLPIKLIPYVIERSGIDARIKSSAVTREMRGSLLRALTDFKISPRRFRSLDEAIITSGGVEVGEISAKTMELKKYPGLYAVGELIDVDAYTGGYNLQIAFSTAYAAAVAVAKDVVGYAE